MAPRPDEPGHGAGRPRPRRRRAVRVGRLLDGGRFGVEVYSPDFAAAERDGVELHLVEPAATDRDRGAAYLHVADVDAVHAAWTAAGLAPTPVRDQPWGMREFEVVDPGGNRVRVGRSI